MWIAQIYHCFHEYQIDRLRFNQCNYLFGFLLFIFQPKQKDLQYCIWKVGHTHILLCSVFVCVVYVTVNHYSASFSQIGPAFKSLLLLQLIIFCGFVNVLWSCRFTKSIIRWGFKSFITNQREAENRIWTRQIWSIDIILV